MNIFTFLFVVSTYLLFIIFRSFAEVSLETQLLFSSFFILFIGIPHGAIDHVLFFKKRNLSQIQFYSVYLGLILLFLVLWIYFPFWSLLLFLLISAFHFGESQFSEINTSNLIKYLLYPVWGIALLSTLMHYNLHELIDITTFFKDTNDLQIMYDEVFIFQLYLITNIGSIILLLLLAVKSHMNLDRLFSELFLLLILHITFYLFPFLIAFTMYFVILHSIKVMNQEYQFLKQDSDNFKFIDFFKILIPYSLLSIFFTALIIALSYVGVISYSVPLVSIIIISVITLPHAIVMHVFYNE
ncbi:Brp/Blh family beta-carotene 15,15'-dioxygenase [Flavobacteriales bacterium]|nr:Brp/Blh family beta-carotene 15,15'-dioxygenase [Flavobacteriales bacterium]